MHRITIIPPSKRGTFTVSMPAIPRKGDFIELRAYERPVRITAVIWHEHNSPFDQDAHVTLETEAL